MFGYWLIEMFEKYYDSSMCDSRKLNRRYQDLGYRCPHSDKEGIGQGELLRVNLVY